VRKRPPVGKLHDESEAMKQSKFSVRDGIILLLGLGSVFAVLVWLLASDILRFDH
jgi:hypothetical protein